ncbi:hypothetical protein R84B8_02160 [Treponema sp. R8-4-B8]
MPQSPIKASPPLGGRQCEAGSYEVFTACAACPSVLNKFFGHTSCSSSCWFVEKFKLIGQPHKCHITTLPKSGIRYAACHGLLRLQHPVHHLNSIVTVTQIPITGPCAIDKSSVLGDVAAAGIPVKRRVGGSGNIFKAFRRV